MPTIPDFISGNSLLERAFEFAHQASAGRSGARGGGIDHSLQVATSFTSVDTTTRSSRRDCFTTRSGRPPTWTGSRCSVGPR